MPIALSAVAIAADGDQPATAADMAARIVNLPQRTADGTRFGLHLCVGDMNHKAFASAASRARSSGRDAARLVAG